MFMSRLIHCFDVWVVRFEPPHDKTNKMACEPSEDSGQPGHPHSLISFGQPSLSAWRKLGSLATHWAHREDGSDWVDAQADLSLRWAHSHFVGFVMRRLLYHCDHLAEERAGYAQKFTEYVQKFITYLNLIPNKIKCHKAITQLSQS